MPASWSMIRTVPGAKVGPGGSEVWLNASGGSAIVVGVSPDRPATRATTTTTTRARAPNPISQGVRPRGRRGGPDDDSSSDDEADSGCGGASSGELRTSTPGPRGVVTSDQPTPFHQRA